jgi:hypothetical protein
METRDQYTVVLEEILSQLKVFGESLDDLKTDFASLKSEFRAGFERMDQRFDRLETRADGRV